MTAHQFDIDAHVHWTWRCGETQGRIVRNRSAANPAYLMAMIDGREMLKLRSEVSGG